MTIPSRENKTLLQQFATSAQNMIISINLSKVMAIARACDFFPSQIANLSCLNYTDINFLHESI